jgi:hypothetical protein
MLIYRRTEEIFESEWMQIDKDNTLVPGREFCNTWLNLTYRDVRLWETIYHIPGGVSVYGAWDPYIEFYMIVHDLFKHRNYGIETFYGPDAKNQIKIRSKEFGISLPENNIWVDLDHMWMHKN